MTETNSYYHHPGLDSIEAFNDREKVALFRRALERILDEHPSPATTSSPNEPCVVCAIAYGTLRAADKAKGRPGAEIRPMTSDQTRFNSAVSAVACPACGERGEVLETRRTVIWTGGEAVRRRRSCADCRTRWTTYEIHADTVQRLRLGDLHDH